MSHQELEIDKVEQSLKRARRENRKMRFLYRIGWLMSLFGVGLLVAAKITDFPAYLVVPAIVMSSFGLLVLLCNAGKVGLSPLGVHTRPPSDQDKRYLNRARKRAGSQMVSEWLSNKENENDSSTDSRD
jgi:hypothetical protein